MLGFPASNRWYLLTASRLSISEWRGTGALAPVTKFTKKDGMPAAFAMQLTADSPFPHSFPANFPSPPHYLSKAIAPDAARYPSSLALRTGIRADFSTQH